MNFQGYSKHGRQSTLEDSSPTQPPEALTLLYSGFSKHTGSCVTGKSLSSTLSWPLLVLCPPLTEV